MALFGVMSQLEPIWSATSSKIQSETGRLVLLQSYAVSNSKPKLKEKAIVSIEAKNFVGEFDQIKEAVQTEPELFNGRLSETTIVLLDVIKQRYDEYHFSMFKDIYIVLNSLCLVHIENTGYTGKPTEAGLIVFMDRGVEAKQKIDFGLVLFGGIVAVVSVIATRLLSPKLL
jgi:preprotein translocase subunit Sec61beta